MMMILSIRIAILMMILRMPMWVTKIHQMAKAPHHSIRMLEMEVQVHPENDDIFILRNPLQIQRT